MLASTRSALRPYICKRCLGSSSSTTSSTSSLSRCRFSTSPSHLVKRPQKPYPFRLPEIDANGRPVTGRAAMSKEEVEKRMFYDKLANDERDQLRGGRPLPSGRAGPFGLRSGVRGIERGGQQGQGLGTAGGGGFFGDRVEEDGDEEEVGRRGDECRREEARGMGMGMTERGAEPGRREWTRPGDGGQLRSFINAQRKEADREEVEQRRERSPRPLGGRERENLGFGLYGRTTFPPDSVGRDPMPVSIPPSSHDPVPPSFFPPPSQVNTNTNANTDSKAWAPTKKLTFAAMDGLRALHKDDPVKYNRAVLSQRFGISQEAVRRILKSSWQRTASGSRDGEGPLPASGQAAGMGRGGWEDDEVLVGEREEGAGEGDDGLGEEWRSVGVGSGRKGRW